jgi:hypothetical protein
MGRQLHTLGPTFIFEKKKMHVHVCLKIFVDLRIVI